jgi:hypothetical protein
MSSICSTAAGSRPRPCKIVRPACGSITLVVRSRRLPRGSRGLRHRHVQAIRLQPWPTALLAPESSLCACASRHRQLSTAWQYHTRNRCSSTSAEALADIEISHSAARGDDRPRRDCRVPSVVTEGLSRQIQDLATDSLELNHTIVGRGIFRDARYRIDDPVDFSSCNFTFERAAEALGQRTLFFAAFLPSSATRASRRFDAWPGRHIGTEGAGVTLVMTIASSRAYATLSEAMVRHDKASVSNRL